MTERFFHHQLWLPGDAEDPDRMIHHRDVLVEAVREADQEVGRQE